MDLDTKVDGKVPRGMEITHQDDSEGGQGVDNDADASLILDNEDAGDSKELTNVNLDPARRKSDAVAMQHPKPEDRAAPSDLLQQDDDDEEDADEEGEGTHGNDEDDEDENEDEDDDEDEDDEDDEEGTEQRPKKKVKRRMKVNKYVDIEVEVDEDEDEEDDEEAGEAGYEEAAADIARGRGGRQGMIVPDALLDDEGAAHADERDHRDYERRARDREEAEAQRIAREYKERHRQRRGTGIGALQALGEFAPKNVLVPSVDDPSIWRVKCKIGRERELVMSISRKAIAEVLQITSAFQRDSFHGHLYVESRSEAHVKEAIKGLIGIYGGTALALVPIEEMPDLLKSRRKETPLTVGGWVRIKRGTYKGDLAQIDDVPEGTDMVTLKVVPRINLNPKDDIEVGGGQDSQAKKRRRAETSMFRPAPKFFNADEVRQAYAGRSKIVKDAEGFHFERELYANGYLIKDFRLTAIDRENIDPTIDEITRFMGETNAAAAAAGDASGTIGSGGNKLDLDLVAEAARAQAVLQPGDYIEIFEGSQKGIIGTVDSVVNNVLTISPTEPADLAGTKIEVLAHQVRKRFKIGDHVKVMRGKNINESGLILKIQDDLVTFLSDLSIQEVTVFSKDIREAAEVGTGSSSSSQYELHDLVQLDADTVGVIFKIEPSTFRVIDQSGTIRSIRANQISNKLDTRRAVATDSEGYELRNGDSVKEVSRGSREPRQGRVLHVHRSLYAFLHNRDIVENGGVFVTYARSLGSIVPRGNRAGTDQNGFDTTRMNPNILGQNGGMGPPAAPPGAPRGREVAIGLSVTVIKGNHKGYKGIIKDLNGPLARVELHTNMKTITIERNKLGTLSNLGIQIPLAQWETEKMQRRPGGIAYGPGAMVPPSPYDPRRLGQSPSGNTPMSTSMYSSGKTPMHKGGATPFGGAFGGATPFGGAGGATPFGAFGAGSATPYASGRTPAYGGRDSFAASSATPFTASGSNAFSANSRTPYTSAAGGGNDFGGATPYGGAAGRSAPRDVWASVSPAYQPNTSTANDSWASASPAYNAASSSSYGASNMSTSAPTPAATAATPAPSAWDSMDPPYRPSANRPDAWATEQPDSGPSYNSAPTPSAPSSYLSAPTPAADSSWDAYTAPTPAATAPTPYASAATPAGDAWD